MSKKIVILGGGTGTSTLVRGLKEFPVDISVVVSVCDDGSSTAEKVLVILKKADLILKILVQGIEKKQDIRYVMDTLQ